MEEMFNDLHISFDENSFFIPSSEELEEAKRMIQEKDVSVIQRLMKEKVNKWKEQNLHCGITGASGSGKSSFINAIRNLKGEDEGAAAVGVTETTKVPTPYKDPTNPKVVYWDLPGVGTDNFPKDETYLEKVGFDKYDFFLIVSCTRFTDNDIWLAKQIKEANKRFYFIRTKLDDDLRNQRREYRSSYDEQKVRDQIHKNTIDGLKKQGIVDPKVFLVSNPYPEIPDFPNLIIELTRSLPLHKREAMTMSIHSFSKEIILEKKKILARNIYYLAGLSALGAAVPVPGLSMVADVTIIMNELSNYRAQFGLEDDDLHHYNLGNEKVEFIKQLSTKEAVLKLFSQFAKSTVAEEVARFIPIIGSIIASGASFYTTYSMLNVMLNKMTDIAIEIMEKRFNDMVEDMSMD